MVDGTSLLTFRPDSLFKALESTMLSTTRAFSRPSFVTLSSFRSPLIRTRPPTAMLLWSSSHAVPRVRRKSRKATKDDIEPPVLEKTLREIEKDFGKNVLIRLGDQPAFKSHEVIPTGSLGLDIAIGIGGVPRGRITEIYGPESSGKTTLALHMVAEAQKRGGQAVFVDAEHALDPSYARRIGVDVDNLYLSQPENGEQALEICDHLIRSNVMDIIVVDSVAALVPKAELEGEMGDAHVGLHARLMSQAARKLTAAISQTNCCLIFINQLRMKIGVMFGSPEVTTGGQALKFYSSVRLDTRKGQVYKKGEDIVGSQIKVTVKKNKMAPPFRTAVFDLDFDKGVSKCGELVDLGVHYKVIEKAGSWYSFNGKQLGQGREKVKSLLESDSELANSIDEMIRDRCFAVSGAIAPPEGEGDLMLEAEDNIEESLNTAQADRNT